MYFTANVFSTGGLVCHGRLMSSSRIILLLRGFSTGCCESQGMQNAELSQKEEGATGDNVRTGIVEPISLPPIHLPQKLQEAVNRVLLDYPTKSLIQDGELLVRNLLSRRPPLSRIVSRTGSRSANTNSSSSSVEDEHRGEVCEEPVKGKEDEKEEQDGVDEQWDTDFVEDKRSRRLKYSPLRYGKRESIAYIASRLNATYASTYRVLHEISVRCPSFHPETVLDFGSGVGTTVWAVNELWRDSVYEYQCVDVSEKIEMVARSLRTTDDSEGSESEIQNVYFKQYLPISSAVTYDLVVSAYSLSDIPTIVMRKSTVRSLWGKTNRFLVLIEVGNLAGFSILAEARSMLLNSSQAQDAFHESVENSGHVFAPCPHDRQCPMIGGSKPCHFGQRSQLSLIERTSPLRNHGFHIEKFSYLVLQKGPRTETETKSRVLQPVRKRSRHLICTACCPDGEVRNQVVSKGKWRASYKALRSSKWGDRVEITPSQTELDES